MTDVKFEDFLLKKSKVKQGVVEIEYSLNVKTNGSIRHPLITDKIEMPHPDLIASIDAFHETLMQSWGMKTDDQELGESVTVTGVDVSGKDDLKGLIITGKKAVTSGAVAMNSPRIRFNGSAFGFEEQVETFFGIHVTEVFKALYDNKSAQLTLFGEAPEGELPLGEDPPEENIQIAEVGKRKK